MTGAEYEAIHGCWCKAIKVLPDFYVVHKQDWFSEEKYTPELHKDDMSFLSRSFERHIVMGSYATFTLRFFAQCVTDQRVFAVHQHRLA